MITPPLGVRAQTAPPEVWDPTSEVTPRVSPTITTEELRALDAEEAPRRTREARDASVLTLDQVGTVRSELKADIYRVEGKVETLNGHIIELHKSTSQISGEIGVIKTVLEEDREERRAHNMVKFSAMTAEIDVGKAQGLAEVEVGKRRQLTTIAVKKQIAYKVLAGLGAAWAAISAGMLANC